MKSLFLYVLTFFYHSDHHSDSDYSYDSDASTRRPSKGAADRRRVAILQMPSRRGLALVAPPDAAPTNYTSSHNDTPPITPEIGQPKEIHIPVAGPVVVNLDSHSPSLSISSYLHYQPGIFFFPDPRIKTYKLSQVYIPSLVRYPLLQEPIST